MTDMNYEEMKKHYEILKKLNSELITLCQSKEKRYDEVNPSWKMNVGEKSITKYFIDLLKKKFISLAQGLVIHIQQIGTGFKCKCILLRKVNTKEL